MTPHRHRRCLASTLLIGSLLLALVLACEEDQMRARDLPVWQCPTQPPVPNPMPANSELLTPPPATYTPFPPPTPHILMTDFPLDKHVRIGVLRGIGLGVWVWMDNVDVHGPYPYNDPATGETTSRWVVQWDITVENASFTRDYEVYPFAQFYVLEGIEADGTTRQVGAWGVSAEAHDQIGIPRLNVTEDVNTLAPGDQRTFTVAAYIPTPDVWRFGYVLDPLDTVNVEEMVRRNTLGSNVGVWINDYDNTCEGEITPNYTPHPFAHLTPAAVSTTTISECLFAGYPVRDFTITRGFGCVPTLTGVRGGGCPESAPWFHNGVDFAVPLGAPVYNVLENAFVQVAGSDTTGIDCATMPGSDPPHQGYGNYTVTSTIDLPTGYRVESWHGHLSRMDVPAGVFIDWFSVIGGVGSTGCSTGPHLHWTIRIWTESAHGEYIDPLSLVCVAR